jgi:phosphatidylethanolamine-binding protein (PEBP) family uncharacterized protein
LNFARAWGMTGGMTSFKFRSAPVWALALATAPWWLGSACSDDASGPDGDLNGGSPGTGGTVAAGGDGGNVGVSGAGGSAGSSGAGGSAGADSAAGSGGSTNPPDAGPGPDAGGSNTSAQAFTLTSPAFDDNAGCGPDDREACDLFPDENINLGDAANVSPEIHWTGAPAGTQSYAIALHDLTFSMGNDDPFTHWVMWNIPASATGLPAELPAGANPGAPAPAGSQQVSYDGSGTNGGYVGSGACGNVYEFVLFALGTPSFDPGSTDPDAVEDAIAGSSDVLGTATMRARSDPNGPTCN